MPARWVIFLIANYLQALATTAMLVFLLYNLPGDLEGDMSGFFALAVIVMIIIILNNCFNIFTIHRFYPDKSMSAGRRNLNIFLLVLYSLATILTIYFTVYGITSEIEDRKRGYNSDGGIIACVLLSIFSLLSVYITIMQAILPRAIERNHKRNLENLLEDFGK